MTFKKAKQKLAELAGGEFYSLSYAFTRCSSGEEDAECGVYINGGQWFTARTWETVIELNEIDLGVPKKVNDNQQPKGK